MARTFSCDMPTASIGAADASAGLASLSLVALSVVPSGCGTTADTPQNKIPIETIAIGISHFRFGRGCALEDDEGDGLGDGFALCGMTVRAGGAAPGRRP